MTPPAPHPQGSPAACIATGARVNPVPTCRIAGSAVGLSGRQW
jgi:hypothetical protein